jgi:galactoside O-acetyltransferase
MFLNPEQIRKIGFKKVGAPVYIEKLAVFLRPEGITIGNNVRIDAFCLISAGDEGVVLGSHIHVGAGVLMFGGGGKVQLEDFSNISPRVSIFSVSDDFSGNSLSNPMIPERFKKLRTGDVTIKRHAIIGCGSVVMPGVTVGPGAAVGALSFVNGDVPGFTIVAGCPARRVGKRSDRLITLEKEFLREAKSRRR